MENWRNNDSIRNVLPSQQEVYNSSGAKNPPGHEREYGMVETSTA